MTKAEIANALGITEHEAKQVGERAVNESGKKLASDGVSKFWETEGQRAPRVVQQRTVTPKVSEKGKIQKTTTPSVTLA